MKSRPKKVDEDPSQVVVWRSFVDTHGAVRPLPNGVLVTSRQGRRNHHYALVCHSCETLSLGDGGAFDPTAFRNVGEGRAVGASQVTALLERTAPDGATDYRVAMTARLVDGYWVKLVDRVEISPANRCMIDDFEGGEDAWLELVSRLRSSPRRSVRHPPEQARLFD